MHIQVVQHVPFEGPGYIGEWAAERGHTLDVTYAITERYPLPEAFDLLVVMGGPMDADDEIASPWLLIEKHFVAETISAGRLVLGVCLGAQIVAEVIGGRVRRGREPEIGWFPVRLADASHDEPLFAGWPHEVVVGHWHGDTFLLPLAMEPVLSSDVTPNQAFVFDGHVVGLQFHLEWDEAALRTMIDACPGDFATGGAHVMTPERFAARIPDHVPACRELLFGLLDRLATRGPRLPEEAAR
jgi:GMP synthase-like glutamine amidotransferase